MLPDSYVGVRWRTVFNCYFLRNKKPVLQSAEEGKKKYVRHKRTFLHSCPYPQTVKRQQLVFTTELLKGFKREFHHSCEKRPKYFTLDVPRIKNYRFLEKRRIGTIVLAESLGESGKQAEAKLHEVFLNNNIPP